MSLDKTYHTIATVMTTLKKEFNNKEVTMTVINAVVDRLVVESEHPMMLIVRKMIDILKRKERENKNKKIKTPLYIFHQQLHNYIHSMMKKHLKDLC